MDFSTELTGALFWSAVLSIFFVVVCSIAIGFFAKKSPQLKPIGTSLKLIVFFIAIQFSLFLGATERYPHLSRHLNFFSWLLFTFAAVRLILYIYGDLFIVRWKKGSFPAAFKNIITAAALVLVTLILLKEILDINVTSLIATTTVLTATIGLAFQGTLANMLAGLTIHLEKPLKQGDWIAVAGHEGRVTDITLRSTRILTLDQNEVFIPNSKVLSESVVNFSLPGREHVKKLVFGVSYNTPPNKVKQVVFDVLGEIPDVCRHPAPLIRVASYGDYSVNYELRYAIGDFSRSIDIDAQIMNLLWYRFKRSGIHIPLPIRDVNLRQITPEFLKAENDQQTAKRIELMENVEILAPLSKTELKKLSSQLSVRTYAVGEMPVRQGDPGDSFYIIKSGKVDVIVENAPGESAVVATLTEGNFFGEMSLLTGATRTASILVTEDAEFIVIDKQSFTSTLIHNPSIAESLSHILSERQAGLDAEKEKLDTEAFSHRKKAASSKLLAKIRNFFGMDL